MGILLYLCPLLLLLCYFYMLYHQYQLYQMKVLRDGNHLRITPSGAGCFLVCKIEDLEE